MVRAALRDLPEEYADRLENLDFLVTRVPSRRDRQRNRLGNATLYGFYEGTPLTQRTSAYDFAMPDRIYVFWGPLARDFPDEADLEREVRNTVYHEIAHYFGMDEDDLTDTRVR